MLKHPKTGRTVSVTDREAGFYTDNGWTVSGAASTKAKPAAEASGKPVESKKEPADGADTGSGKPTARKAAKDD